MIKPNKRFKMKNVKDCESVSEVLETMDAVEEYQLRPITEFPSYRGVFDGNGNSVAIVNKTYPLLQPAKAFDYVDVVREELGMKFDTAGFTKEGRRMFVSCRKENAVEIDLKVGDTMDEVLYFWTSFDGSTQNSFSQMLERLVCTNGMVAKDVQSSTRVKHSAQMEGKLQGYVDQIEGIKEVYAETTDSINRLVDQKVSHPQAQEVINRLFKGESKRAENIREEVFHRFSNGMGNRGETAWDLLNGITEYQNHGKAHRSSRTSSVEENRLTSLTLGADATLMNQVWEECLQLN
jgi:phage/plasmid-like protein (TIGR03299 family)